MLVLTRKTQEQIQIGDNIRITIVRVKGQSVRVGIEAPKDVRVVRGELTVGDSKPRREAVVSASSQQPASDEMAAAASVPCRAASSTPSRLSAAEAEARTCNEPRRRLPGASLAPLIRRQRSLGPASLRALGARLP